MEIEKFMDLIKDLEIKIIKNDNNIEKEYFNRNKLIGRQSLIYDNNKLMKRKLYSDQRLIKYYDYYYDDNDLIEIKEYDGENYLLEYTKNKYYHFNIYSIECTIQQQIKYEYDGRIKSYIEFYKHNNLIDQYIYEIIKNINNHKFKLKEHKRIIDDKVEYVYYFEYDKLSQQKICDFKNNKLMSIEDTHFNWIPENLITNFISYEYDENYKNLIKKERYNNDNDKTPTNTNIYKYDNFDNLIETKEYNENNELNYQYNFEFDKFNRLIKTYSNHKLEQYKYNDNIKLYNDYDNIIKISDCPLRTNKLLIEDVKHNYILLLGDKKSSL